MQLSYDYAKDRALMCLRANYESHLGPPRTAPSWSGGCCGRTKTSGSFTFRRDPYTSMRSRNAGAEENESCSSPNTIGRLLTCVKQSLHITGLQDSSWTYSNLLTETRRYTAQTFDRHHNTLQNRENYYHKPMTILPSIHSELLFTEITKHLEYCGQGACTGRYFFQSEQTLLVSAYTLLHSILLT